jgi:hypothetical protein
MSEKSLSKKQLDAIAYLLGGRSQQETAELIGLNSRTIRRWYADSEEFRTELENGKQTSYQVLLGELLGGCPIAVSALVEIAGDRSQKACDRVAASRALLSSGVRAVLGESLDHATTIVRKYGFSLKDEYGTFCRISPDDEI